MADSSTTGRNLILVGVLLGLGAAAAGFYVSSSFEAPSVDVSMRGSGDIASLTQKVQTAYDEARRDVVVFDIAPQNAIIERDKIPGPDGKLVKNPEGKVPRYTPIFFAPQLWITQEPFSPGDNIKCKVVDLLASGDSARPLHGNVPNAWFFRYGLDDVIVSADALTGDKDGDGFTNQEEFAAQTDPGDPSSHPGFVVDGSAKMSYIKRHVDKYEIELSSTSDFGSSPDSASIVVNIYKGGERILQAKDLKPGSSFGLSTGADDSVKSANRFKILSAKSSSEGNMIEVEDTYTKNEAAKNFTIFSGKTKKVAREDIFATLSMTAGSAKGKTLDHPIQVGESFAVPGFEGTTATLTACSAKEVSIKVGDVVVNIKRMEREKPAPKDKK